MVLLAVWQSARQVPLSTLCQRVVRWRTMLWVCRELVRWWGGSTDWDGRPDEIQEMDSVAVFEEAMPGQGGGWGRFVISVTWLQETHAPD